MPRFKEEMPMSPAGKLKPNLLTAETAWKQIEEKLGSKYKTVQRAFISMDMDADGYINLREFRMSLEHLGIYMTGSEFRKLWRQFDASGDGKINFTEFNNRVGQFILPYASGLQMKRPETPKMREWQRQALAKGIQKKVKDIEAAFQEIDTDGSGRISHAEFIQALKKVGLAKVGDQESYQMMQKYKKEGNHTGEMTFEEFRDCMQDYLRIPTGLNESGPKEKPTAALETAEKKVAAFLPKDVDAICALFKPFDPHGSGEVVYDDFRRGLENCDVRLTDAQFLSLCFKLDAIDDGIIAYRDFARMVCGGDKTVPGASNGPRVLDLFANWVKIGLRPQVDVITGRPYDKDVAAKQAAVRMGISEMEAKLAHALIGRKQDLKSAFLRYDSHHCGEMSKADVGHMLESLDVPVNNDLISTLFSKYDVNKNGMLEYDEWFRWMSPMLELSEANLRRLGLERMLPHEQKDLKAQLAAMHGQAAEASSPPAAAPEATRRHSFSAHAVGSRASAPGVASTVNRIRGIANSASAASGSNFSDLQSVATANLDLEPTYAKMRKVLGKSALTVLAGDIKKKAIAQASKYGGDVASLSSGVVPASIVRDSLAERGVALTSKEVRAISMRYHGSGSAATRTADGVVDLDRALNDIMNQPSTGSAMKARVWNNRVRSPSPQRRAHTAAGAGRPARSPLL